MMLHVIGAKPLHIDMARFVDGDFHHPRIVDKFPDRFESAVEEIMGIALDRSGVTSGDVHVGSPSSLW